MKVYYNMLDDFDNMFKIPRTCKHITKVVHLKSEECDIVISRPSKWGNPFTHIKDKKTLAKFICSSRKEAMDKYREWIENGDGKSLLNDLYELKDKNLGCWCKSEKNNKHCHGDVLIELITKYCI